MELLQLKYFLAVAESEHMTNTAKQLHIAQPALTQSIHRLEQELGVRLFERAGRGIRLSPAGAYVRDRVKPRWKPSRMWRATCSFSNRASRA